MSHRDRRGEVWEGASTTHTNSWSGLHIVVKSEEERAHPGRTRHTTLSLERGVIRFANEPTDCCDGWDEASDMWWRFL